MRLSVLGFLKIRFIGVLLSEESNRKTRPNYAGSLYIVIWMGGAKLSRPGIIRKPEYWRLSRPRNRRHSHATLLDSAGAPLGTVEALLGHSTSELTGEVYLHAIPEDQRRAVASVEALLFGPKWTQIVIALQTSA